MTGPNLSIGKTCSRKDCEQASAYQVGFTFRPIDGRPSIPAQTSLTVCEPHRTEMTIDDVLSDDMRDACRAVMRALNGVVDPDGYVLTFTAVQ